MVMMIVSERLLGSSLPSLHPYPSGFRSLHSRSYRGIMLTTDTNLRPLLG